MGGGSSNAASVLLGLNRLWKLRLTERELAKLGAKIGSDVPFFVYNCSFALGTGRGEKIRPWKNLKNVEFWHIIVVPGINVSTALIYRKWDRLKSLRLTRSESSVKLISLALRKFDRSLLTRAISNSLEPVTESLFPEVRKVKKELLAEGLRSVFMSGSGPSVFGIVASKKEGVALRKSLKSKNPSWNVFLAKTM
jgi:4-diphosphocytidyl-2-C-methyl-D-erythritol kinase